MEQTCNGQYIIEFNGLPGTGKSTIANYIESILKGQGYVVYREYFCNQHQRNNKSLFFSMRWLLLIAKICLLSLSIKPLKNRINGIIAFVKYLRMYYVFYKIETNAILITDEGIIQAITSIFHLDRIEDDSIVKKILNLVKDRGMLIFRVDCKSDVELSSSRIEQRGLTGARLDSLEPKKRIDALMTQAANLDVIRSLSSEALYWSAIAVDTSLSPEYNAQIICERFNDYGK